MTLSQYKKKRDFSKTPEPEGISPARSHFLFVIQKHAASHLHYDFRLELKGVLKSWAIPKGPSLDSTVKRLAMQVEDHPIAYGNFEGIIPKGQYGGGTVMLWDNGHWVPLDKNPQTAYEKGHLRFELQGKKLKGRWDLIRFKDEKHWFLIKYKDAFEKNQKDYDVTEEDKSVLSHQTMDGITDNYQHVWSIEGLKSRAKKIIDKMRASRKKNRFLPKDLKSTSFPDFISPQLATLVNEPPQGNQWLHEIKFDGYRILAFKKGDSVVLKSRTNKAWTTELPSIVNAVKTLPITNVVLDGEVVLLDKEGKSDFQLLQNAIKDEVPASFVYYIFDILYYEQYDLRFLPLVERKSILKSALHGDSSVLYYSDHILNDGQSMFTHACKLALEGIISKRADAPYHSNRSSDWLKIKCVKRQEFIIGGYTNPQGKREHFGALFLGVMNNTGELDYVGNVGTGFTKISLKEIYQALIENSGSTNPFTTTPPGARCAHWLIPNLVCEVEFTEWTKDGHLRHPSFKGLRMDKEPLNVIREKEMPTTKATRTQKTKKIAMKSPILTHPNKILYLEDKITKQDLFTYYEEISDYILPYLLQRPLTLLRCPSSYTECFYQRHYNAQTPKTLYPVDIESDKKREQYLYLNDKNGLLNLVQMGVLEIHPWGSRINHIEQPDLVVIDLDPAPDVPWKKVVAAAKDVKEHLMNFQLQSFVKSTGGKGLHVVVPIKPEYDWDEVKEFTHVFVQFLEKLKPNDYVSQMSKTKRTGKIFIDYLRNQRTATAIGTYSTRARIHAPISTPLFWDELSPRKEDNTYTIKTLPKRIKELKNDPWHDFWTIKQSLRLDEL